jgi:hypothetical protein
MKALRVIVGCVAVSAMATMSFAATPQKGIKGAKRAAKAQHLTKGSILFDQTSGPTGQGWTSQDFESAFDAYDSMGADDFTVPAPGWLVNEVFSPGFNQGIPFNNMNITFFMNSGGLPGAPVAGCTYANVTAVDDGLGNITTALTPACALVPGTYWVMVQGREDFGTSGQWFWADNTINSGATAKWQNPGGGFGTPCTTWQDLSTCLGGAAGWGFQLSGQPLPVELQSFEIQ